MTFSSAWSGERRVFLRHVGILLSGSRLVAATNKKILTYEVDSSSSLVQAEELTVKDIYGKVTYKSDNSMRP